MSEPRSTPAIVLFWRSYGESDKIVTLLTRDHGKLAGIAKGAKNSKRRFVNSLEPLARVHLHYRIKPNASLAFLESADLLHPLIVEPTRFAYANYLGELTEQLTGEGHPVVEVYELLEEALAALEHAPASSAFLRAFELRLLICAGYEPRLDSCAGCAKAIGNETIVHLDAVHGTVRCPACRAAERATIEVSGPAVEALRALRDAALADCQARSLGGLGDPVSRITGRLLEVHLHRPLRSPKLIAQLAAGSDAGR